MKFQSLFEPKAMAVVGVSLNNDRHPANVIYNKTNLRYPVKVFPVNPKRTEIRGLQCYPSVLEIEEAVDLAIIIIPAGAVLKAIGQCAEKGIRSVVVISAFSTRSTMSKSSMLHRPQVGHEIISGPRRRISSALRIS